MAEATHVDSSVQGGVLVATIKSPTVSQYEADVIGRQLQAEAPGGAWRIVLDLSRVELLASAGLGMLVTLQRTAGEHNGRLIVTGAAPETLNILKMTRLDRLIPVAKDVEAGLKKLR
ncbi:MAG: STAS domain-containing protein [Phycisphaerales bacterium JB039]